MKAYTAKTAVLLVLLLLLSTSSFAQTGQRAIQVLEQYFDFLITGNYDIASDMWTPEAVERSSRFGIVYDDIAIKADAGSPIMRNLRTMVNNLTPAARRYEELERNWVRLEYSHVVGPQRITYSYYVRGHDDWYWFDWPQNYYAADWPVFESEFLRVHVEPEMQPFLNKAVLREADAFVTRMADSLELSKEQWSRIAERKIEYFYCKDDASVEQITGQKTHGTYDLASNDVISATFPHFHELTHMLVNLKLQSLPLYTLPILREGIAVTYGGRWGKGPAALGDVGTFLFESGFVNVDSSLTMTGFADDGADLLYPYAGLLSAYLLDELGLEKYLELYRSLSGNFYILKRMKASNVADTILAYTGDETWDSLGFSNGEVSDSVMAENRKVMKRDFMAGFHEYIRERNENSPSGRAGLPEKSEVVFESDGIKVADNKHWTGFEFVLGDDPNAAATLLFGHDDRFGSGKSSLFEEHFGPDQEFKGYRYAVRIDHNEAGLYDYATNELLGKFINGLTPSGEYLDSLTTSARVQFPKELLHDVLPQEGESELLPM